MAEEEISGVVSHRNINLTTIYEPNYLLRSPGFSQEVSVIRQEQT